MKLPFTPKQAALPEFIALIALITSLVALSIDAMLPALPEMGADLGVSDVRQTQWIITSLIFGMSFGQLIFGPLSDAYGRRFGIISGIALFCIGAVVSMLATSLPMLIVGRVIQGIGVAGPRIGAMALVRDRFAGDAMARVMSFVSMVFILVPMLAPLVGQALLLFAGWHSIFGLFIVLSLLATVWMLIRQPETLAVEARRPFQLSSIGRSIVLVLGNPRVMVYAVSSGLVFGGLLSYVASAQSIFQDIYGLGAQFPFYFAALAFGVGVASLVNSQLVMRFGALRLSIRALKALLLISSLLLLSAVLRDGVPTLPMFMVLAFAAFFCLGILFGNLSSLAMLPLGHMAGLGAAVIGSVSNLTAVAISGVVGWFYNETLVPIASGLLITAALALVLALYGRHLARQTQATETTEPAAA